MNTRTPTRVHTRKLDRSVARASMKRAGFVQINKTMKFENVTPQGCKYTETTRSYFAENWRKY